MDAKCRLVSLSSSFTSPSLRLQILILILFILLQRCNAQLQNPVAQQPPEPERKLRDFCSGSFNGRTLAGSEDRFEDLVTMYKNCTKVFGNLEITHLTKSTLGWDDEKMSRLLNIFDDITQIKGYLFIYNVDIQYISFANLRIIWGDDLLDDQNALAISSNHKLREVYMPKMRAIHKGNVRIENNTFLCYMQDTVDWRQLLDMDESRLNRSENSHKQCISPKGRKIARCHESCTHGFCWGREANMCQEIYRDCPHYCSSNQCYEKQSEQNTTELLCCHDTCAGGCTGPGPDHCIACKTMSQDSRCVASCPRLKIHDDKQGKMIPNPEGRYINGRYCVKECPNQLLIEGDACVRHCSDGSHHDMTKSTRRCDPCNGACPKVCHVSKPLTGPILRSLIGCDEIDGFIEIQDSKMIGSEGFTLEDLNVLKTVKMISEYVQMSAQTHSPSNMSFLENLEFIEGRSLAFQKYAMVITKNDNLRFLGLRKLKTIKTGRVIIMENPSLCFAESIKWVDVLNNYNETRISKNMSPEKCQSRRKVCHSTCLEDSGCWGEGPSMCFRCKHWKQDGVCVTKCPETGFYENRTSFECLPCFEQCMTCNGPNETHCLSCRNVAVVPDPEEPISTLQCIEKCPVTHFEMDHSCHACHKSCYSLGCTGKGDHLGQGGCNNCTYAVVKKGENPSDVTIDRCLFAPTSAKDVCKANELHHHFVSPNELHGVVSLHCDECDSECITCTSAGKNVEASGCICRDYAITISRDNDQFCSPGCIKNTYLVRNKTDDLYGVCNFCHPLCDKNEGCSGPTEFDCQHCSNATLIISTNDTSVPKRYQCLSTCPEEAAFLDKNTKICHIYDTAEAHRNRIRAIIGIVMVVIGALLLAVLCVIWRCRQIKMKLKRAQIENNIDMPEMMVIDGSARPNMTRINLITSGELDVRGQELGKGAFGVVHAGFWYPRGKKVKVPVAIKIVRKSIGGMADMKELASEEADMLAEATKMSILKHEHLLRIVGVCMDGQGLKLVTLLRPLGNLLHFLQKHKEHLSGRDLLTYSYQISSAMKYLISHSIIHRDLAARNVLVKRPNHVEVTDFGLSKLLTYGTDEITVKAGKVAFKWLAPEALECVYNEATDVWAFGVTCWEIFTLGESPYRGKVSAKAIVEFLHSGERLSQPNNCSTELYQLLLQCWMLNPDSRPSFAMIKEELSKFCRVPQLYITDPSKLQDLETESQHDLLMEILNESDFADPLNYMDNCGTEPPTPTTDSEHSMNFQFPMARGVRRMQSNGSHRYQTDPMMRPGTSPRPAELGMDDGNYLVPNTKIDDGTHPTVLYTPVVVNENGQTELITSEYYNELSKRPEGYVNQPGAGYVNDIGGAGFAKDSTNTGYMTPRSYGNYVNDGSLRTSRESTDSDYMNDLMKPRLHGIREEAEEVEKESCL